MPAVVIFVALCFFFFLKPQMLKTVDYRTMSEYFTCNEKVLSLLTEGMSFKEVICQILTVSIKYDYTICHILALLSLF